MNGSLAGAGRSSTDASGVLGEVEVSPGANSEPSLPVGKLLKSPIWGFLQLPESNVQALRRVKRGKPRQCARLCSEAGTQELSPLSPACSTPSVSKPLAVRCGQP